MTRIVEIGRVAFHEKAETLKRHNEGKHEIWNTMRINCSICELTSRTIISAYTHSRNRHFQEVKEKDNHVSTCIICLFSHGNPAIVKTHTEIIHTCRRQKLYLQHPKTVSVFEHLREVQRQKLFQDTLKAFLI